MSTVRQITAGAFARRNPNVPNKLATRKELARVLSDYMREVAVKVAAVNPAYFGEFSDVEPNGVYWEQPAFATRVYRIEMEDGTRVNQVEARDRLDAAAPPRLFQVGPFWYSPGEDADLEVGLSADPVEESGSGDVLTFYYGKVFEALDLTLAEETLMEVELDELWRPRHDDLLKDKLCHYMANKDRDATDRTYWEQLVNAGEAQLLLEAELENHEKTTRHTFKPR